MITRYDFFRTKYGEELLIDLISLGDLEKYIRSSPVQRLTYYDITVIVEGNGTFSIDNYEHDLKQGCVFFSSPGQIRKWNTNKVPQGYVLIFEEEFLCTYFNDTQFVQNLSCFNSYDNPPVLQLEYNDYSQLIALLQNVKNEISSFKNYDKHILRALLYQILILLNRKFISVYPSSRKKPINGYVKSFIQLVNTNHHQYRAVDYYAQCLHITSGHLNSLVKDYFRISAKKYILNRNILEAKRMLQYTNMGIDEIAYRLNYENTTYFIRTFREHTNTTPLNFRKQTNP
jgi:AraC family transcriptional regulator, transcriptional activator of pobA